MPFLPTIRWLLLMVCDECNILFELIVCIYGHWETCIAMTIPTTDVQAVWVQSSAEGE